MWRLRKLRAACVRPPPLAGCNAACLATPDPPERIYSLQTFEAASAATFGAIGRRYQTLFLHNGVLYLPITSIPALRSVCLYRIGCITVPLGVQRFTGKRCPFGHHALNVLVRFGCCLTCCDCCLRCLHFSSPPPPPPLTEHVNIQAGIRGQSRCYCLLLPSLSLVLCNGMHNSHSAIKRVSRLIRNQNTTLPISAQNPAFLLRFQQCGGPGRHLPGVS